MKVAEEEMEVVAEEIDQVTKEAGEVEAEVEVMAAEQNLSKNVKQSPELPADKFPHKAAPKYLREAAIRWK